MFHHSLPYRVLSFFLLLALVLPIASQTTVVSAAPDTPLPFLDDFQGGIPSGFVSFVGSGSAVLGTVTDNLPTVPANDGTTVATLAFAVNDWGGVTRDFVAPLDLSGYQALRFWYKGSNSGATINVELKSNGAAPAGANLFLYPFTDNFTNWRYFSIPFSSFVQSTGWNPGASYGPVIDLTEIWGYSIQLPAGATGSFSIDEVSVTGYGAMVDFQSGVPSGFGPFNGVGSSIPFTTTTDDLPTLPAQNGTTVIVVNNYNVTDYGGITYPFTTSEDWSHYQGLSFWYKGGNTGGEMRVELKTAGANAGVSNLFAYAFTDNFSNWRFFNIPWNSFVKRTDYNPGAGLGNTIDHSIIWGYSMLIPAGTGSFSMDNIAPYGGGNDLIVPKAKFSTATYSVDEDAVTATITVNLSAATSVASSVDYATSNGTAVAGTDYTTANGTLNFAAGETSKTFTVTVTGNTVYNAPKTVNLTLSNPVDATLGAPDAAVLLIQDNDTAPNTKIVDDFTGSVAPVYNPFGTAIGFAPWGSENGNVQLSTVSVAAGDPLALPGQTGSKSLLKVDYNIGSWGGFTHALENGNDWVSQDWSRYDGVSFWLYGTNTGGVIQTEVFDNQALGSTGDSATRYYYRITDNYTGWQYFRIPFSAFQVRTDYQPGGAPGDGLNLTEVSGYSFGFPVQAAITYVADYSLYGDLSANPVDMRVQAAAYAYGANEGSPITVKVWLNEPAASVVTVDYAITAGTAVAGINYTDNSGTLTFGVGETAKTVTVVTINDGKIKPTLNMKFSLSNPTNASLGWKEWATLGVLNINTPDPGMIDDFENGLPISARLVSTPAGSITFDWEEILGSSPDAVPGQYPSNYVLDGIYPATSSFTRLFATSRDLTAYDALRFWYKGSNSGQPVKVKLLDGQPDPAPSAWTLVWSDEFGAPTAGVGPNPTYWNHNIGGEGWGNNEWEYYTDSLENSATDGAGNMVITAKPNTDPALQCTYGPAAGSPQTCAYTSARLLTKNKIDFAYGRVEARLQIPHGQGIWPAFWMLGSDIDSNPWPGSGEIDIMENIGKDSEVQNLYGTIHGPGYSGGSGIGSGPYDTGVNLYEGFHTYAIEWEPTQIRWYFDGYNYFTANASDVPAGREWVFNKPFFIILNLATGGNWPGFPDGTTTFPQQMLIDYVRVYQGPDNAQRFESSFVDDSTSWKLVTLPFAGFSPSAIQPAGAASNTQPLLTNARGYGFEFSASAGTFKLDDVRSVDIPTVASIVRVGASPTSAASVEYKVTFSENVVNVDDADFVVTPVTGTFSGANITGISGSGSIYTVTVSTGTGSGTLRLDVAATADIEDLAGNPLGGLPYTGGESYVIAKGPISSTWIGSVSITSDQNVVAVGRPHLGSEVASYIGATGGSTTQYVPMLFKGAFGGTYNAALYLQNVSATAATLSLEFTDSSGAVVYTKTDTLDAHASKGYWLPAETGLPAGFAGGVKVTSTQPILAVGRPHINGQVMTYNGMSAGATTAWLPMFFKNGFSGSYNAALYVQNVTGSSANLTIEYINLDGTVACTDNDTLGANASKGYWSLAVACDTGSLPSGFVGGVKVTSSQNILAVGRAHLGTQITTYNGSAAGATSAYLPMLFKNAFGGSYDAALYLQNVSGSSATVTIEYLNSAGTVAATQNVTLAAKAISSIWLPTVIGLPDDFTGGARISSTQNVIAIGRPHLGSEITTYNGASAGGLTASLPMLFKDAYGGGYDAAFYVQNTSGSAANVEISFYDSAGVLSCIKPIALAAGAIQGFWMPTVTCAP